jgi:inactivated superfamily I helicase
MLGISKKLVVDPLDLWKKIEHHLTLCMAIVVGFSRKTIEIITNMTWSIAPPELQEKRPALREEARDYES